MCKVGYTATLSPTYAIKSFLRCQSQRRRVVVNTLSFCISPRRNFAANHFPHKLRAAIILMSFKSFSVQSRNRKTNLGWGGWKWAHCVASVLFFFFFVMQIYLESFFVWLKETNLQINHLSRLSAARSDRYQAELGNMTVAVLRRWQKMCCSLTGLQRFPDVHVQQLLPPAYARMSKMT